MLVSQLCTWSGDNVTGLVKRGHESCTGSGGGEGVM